MTWPKSRGANLLGEARCDRAWLSDTTYQSTPLDEAASQTHDSFSKHWYPGEVEDQPSPRVAARNPHTVRIIIGIDGNNLCNQRVLLRSDDQKNNATDGNSGKRNVFEIELIEKTFNAFDE